MTEEEKKQRLYCMAVSGGVCEVCGRPLIDGQPQGAHRIGNTQLNRKLYGDIVIDSPLNMGYVCSLACNASLDISQNPHECLKLAKKIYESKLCELDWKFLMKGMTLHWRIW